MLPLAPETREAGAARKEDMNVAPTSRRPFQPGGLAVPSDLVNHDKQKLPLLLLKLNTLNPKPTHVAVWVYRGWRSRFWNFDAMLRTPPSNGKCHDHRYNAIFPRDRAQQQAQPSPTKTPTTQRLSRHLRHRSEYSVRAVAAPERRVSLGREFSVTGPAWV